MKQLYLIRHAKASTEHPELPDIERELTEQGRHQAEKLAQRLKKINVNPSVMLVSPATRAQETAKIIAKGLGVGENKIETKPSLYEENIGLLVEVIKAIPVNQDQVIIVAHNPTLSWFATYLSNNNPVDLSPCGIFAMQFDMPSWDKIAAAEGSVITIPPLE